MGGARSLAPGVAWGGSSQPPPSRHTHGTLGPLLLPHPQAGRKLGLEEGSLRANAATMEALVPGLAPNLEKMKASDWVRAPWRGGVVRGGGGRGGRVAGGGWGPRLQQVHGSERHLLHSSSLHGAR
jgi:hypothetical protein